MFIPGSNAANTNLPLTMNNNLHQQAFLFDNLKDHRSNKLLSSMSRKTSATPNFSLDPDLLRELNARYLHDINSTRTAPGTTNLPLDGNGLPAFLLPPFLRAEHYHQHTHTHEHNLNILTPSNNSLINGTINNSLVDKLSKSDNGLSPFLRTNNFSLPPPPPIFPPFNSANNNNNNVNNNSSTKELVSSPSSKKSNKWCEAHVRISWMIYHQQQRSKEKLSPSDNKKDEEQQKSSLNTKLPDLITNTRPLLPSVTNDAPLQLPSTYPSALLPPPAFNYRSPFDFAGLNSNGPFGRVPPSSSSSSSSPLTTAFGGLGSLFPSAPLPPPPPPRPPSSSLTIDRKPDMNGPVAAAAALGLDWSRFHRGMGPAPMIPPMPSLSSINENSSSKKLDETSNSNYDNKKRSSSVLNNDDDRRSSSSSHLMLPPSHLANANYSSSSNRSRSRSPHPSLHHQHHHHSSNFLTKTSLSSPPLHSSSRKRHSPTVKSANISDTSKSSASGLPSLPLPPTFGALDPLTLSMIERQRLSAAYASLFNAASNSSPNNFFPSNLDSSTFRPNGSPNLFPNLDSSVMTAALMQREHFLNSIRQQHEQINGRERAAPASMSKTSKPSSKPEQITTDETPRVSPKVSTSPGSHSSTSSSSRSSKKVKREKDSPSPSTENIETKLKESAST
ncbi:unnamed protein product [Adineta ricciae]|uniref:Uncharacterized protein n=1 Tax=Adineta ricciae TaxID=249248 RepID=A0A815S4Z8_ADIRI|nr:unnamed protein product [Adineta ricciae]CAF1485499.1 unnamed protein product [Adineta ricciae]